ncbi:hypothetical protein EVAR_22490_1 [Eumeta japonica]|uniref:Uncharacterized protein n=1 Tax=Eumeta variegata TaxID=151549 RepID=A0A4C1VB33_EUMVA|nr:hypothetical protein EVAR_22490_1 [Eumeta japonica]
MDALYLPSVVVAVRNSADPFIATRVLIDTCTTQGSLITVNLAQRLKLDIIPNDKPITGINGIRTGDDVSKVSVMFRPQHAEKSKSAAATSQWDPTRGWAGCVLDVERQEKITVAFCVTSSLQNRATPWKK